MTSPSTSGSRRSLVDSSVVLLMVFLPPLVWWMWWCMVDRDGALAWPSLEMLHRVPWPTPLSVALYLGWFVLQAGLELLVPGTWCHGAPLADGSRLRYKLNGWRCFWLTWAVVALLVGTGLVSATVLYDQFAPLYVTMNLFAFGYSVFLYVHGRRHPDEGTSKTTGGFWHDYVMGTALNPRSGSFDHKLFCEARPGLIFWVAMALSFGAKQYALHGQLSAPMIAVCLFQFWYVADYYWHEEAILSTWDIRHENFGWMLCWGDLVWVPCCYALQALYLIKHPNPVSTWMLVPIALLQLLGYIVFRGSNLQKHRFRKDPEALIWGKKPESIATSRGTLLLVSGFWGMARHMNYLGDLMMGLAWCLVCGFDRVLPYFYVTYFTILLVHRAYRDNLHCAVKYGADWDRYCARVRWRIVPGLY